MENLKANILVVDDEPEIVDTLKNFLSRKGYGVSGALSGEEALAILEKERVDLILLDIKLPGIQGEEIARIVKNTHPYIKIIIISGFTNEAQNTYKNRCLEGVFTKPVRLNELYNKVLNVFNPEDSSALGTKLKPGIKARMLLIKAKLLFVEPSPDIYNFLSTHFKMLSNKGENYELDVADSEEKVIEKLMLFKPDIFVVNASLFKGNDLNTVSRILDENSCSKEIIVYNLENTDRSTNEELERLTQAIETVCFKNGFMEIKWMEI